MNNLQQDLYYDQSSARSPGSQQRQLPPQNPGRQATRGLDAYGQMPNSAPYATDDQSGRFDTNRFDRMNTAFQTGGGGSGYVGFDLGGSQTWNPAAFGGPNTFTTFTPLANTRMKHATTRGRANLPPGWVDNGVPPINNGMNGFGGIPGPSMMENHPMRPPQHPFIPETDDELIPTAIVIKNIPFAVKKEQLVEVMTDLNLPLPYAFNYHFDNGVFRGLAFANFTSPEETAAVITALNHYELQGRKLRVEYKKMLPLQERERIEREKRKQRGQLEEQHRPMAPQNLQTQHSMSSIGSGVPAASSPSPVSARPPKLDVDLNDPQNMQYYGQLFAFKEDTSREVLIFPATLTPPQRRVVHTLAHHLNLQHISRGSGEQRQVHVVRSLQGSGISPPIPQGANFHMDSSRRVLNRAATTDFNESRDHPGLYGTMRPGQAGLHLGIPDSPGGFNNRAELRAAKSHADLRSYTPSPINSQASLPAGLLSNMARFQDANGPQSASGTPNPSVTALGGHDDNIINGIANMGIGSGFAPNGSPRRLRGMFSWETNQAPPHTAPIGSNRGLGGVGSGFGDNARNAGAQNMPIRQPSGPERGPGFVRGRQNGHQARSSDELRHSQPEIIVE